MTLKISDLETVLAQRLANVGLPEQVDEIGEVVSSGDGVVRVYGLDLVQAGEVVEFENEVSGLAFNLEHDNVGVVILGEENAVPNGSRAKRTREMLSIGVGHELLGRVVDALGRPIDGKGEIKATHRACIEVTAPGIVMRKSVSEPMNTGIKAIDALVPIGRGQRELIIGDRKTGKTSIAIDAILNQARSNQKSQSDSDKVFCVYVAIGQRQSAVAKIAETLREAGAMDYSVIVSASASDPASMQFLAPYAGCSIAEFFRDNGMHALVIYDDLSKHAVAYRQMSLILRRPPGREAFPGDVFYIHSRLLERAAKMSDELGGGSLTALPIIETQAGDLSAYIPTNVISITDGQIFLEASLFYNGYRPAVNLGLSVSRVGSAAQSKAMKQAAGSMKLDLAQFRELKAFAQFGSDLDEVTKRLIDRGMRLTEMLKQDQYSPMSTAEQVVAFFAVQHGYMDQVQVKDIRRCEQGLCQFVEQFKAGAIIKQLERKMAIDADLEHLLREAITQFLCTFDLSA